MASWGGHTLPGTFFIIFGIFYAFKFAASYLKRPKNGRKGVTYCCKGRIPFSGIVIEGVIKVFMITIGILVELFYPGAPMGHLHNDQGNLTHPMNWQHATMYFFFGLSGIADILSFTARNIVPLGFDRIFGALALFIEGYLFFFHLHGRSDIDTRVHILLVLAVWPGALFTFLHCFVMRNRKLLHIFEMITALLLIVQGTWFWQAAYILYPPNGDPMDPCMIQEHQHAENAVHMQTGMDNHDCNARAGLNMMFITLFWSWHIAAAICFVGVIYFLVYQIQTCFLWITGLLLLAIGGRFNARYLKCRDKLDPSFLCDDLDMDGVDDRRRLITSAGPRHEPLLSEEDEI